MSQDILVLIEHFRGQVQEISYLLLAAGRALADASGARLLAILFGQGASGLAHDLAADEVLYVDDPNLAEYTPVAYIKTAATLIQERMPPLVLFGDTSIGAEVAAGLSARLDFPMVSYCRTLSAEGGRFKYQSQICGGKIMVEGKLPDKTCLVTMIPGGYKTEQGHSGQAPKLTPVAAPPLESGGVLLRGYIEPQTGDVDISKEAVLVAVGRGLQNQENLPVAEELAQALGGVVVGSRPVVDQGWLPTTRLVGKSGKRVKPIIYLALGISGAPEHAEAIVDTHTIIAINTDLNAPIFNIAKFGAVMDMHDLIPVLTETVKRTQPMNTVR
jgi:electron transfer flavoprotein alpha subunit